MMWYVGNEQHRDSLIITDPLPTTLKCGTIEVYFPNQHGNRHGEVL